MRAHLDTTHEPHLEFGYGHISCWLFAYCHRLQRREHGVRMNAGAGGEGQGARAQRSAKLLPLLRAGLAGAASAPLPDNSTTLALAVDAASPQTRVLVRLVDFTLLCSGAARLVLKGQCSVCRTPTSSGQLQSHFQPSKLRPSAIEVLLLLCEN